MEKEKNKIKMYLFGTPMEKIDPPLSFLGDEDYIDKATNWVTKQNLTNRLWALYERPIDENIPDDDPEVLELWFGSIPADYLDDNCDRIETFKRMEKDSE